MLAMLKGAMAELEVGDPRKLSVDVGPVITAEARDAIDAHVEAMRARGFAVTQAAPPAAAAHGTFVAPTIIEIEQVADVEREVFGPVLHVLRYRREELDALIDAINAAGYGLTFGLHTRIDETIARVVERIEAGNIYVNRNIIGAMVGVQPFGGRACRERARRPAARSIWRASSPSRRRRRSRGSKASPSALGALSVYIDWLRASGHARGSRTLRRPRLALAARGARRAPGPVGERNVYALRRRGGSRRSRRPKRRADQIGAILAPATTRS